ncbi:hypothetical protein L1987_72460 [Smallanthus sonchifolius]|uniref:Uncharacterized protein n=1 Tax=Smallanthus sonchifolius TaxID=185202 RepID=A0ACB9AVZ9_9ASTR|nr:hypothetical protein L1987_72460 [Smallanthus sonchifolius]
MSSNLDHRYQKMLIEARDVPNLGFNFDLYSRNDMLTKKGLKPPGYLKTGTTIVGLIYKEGVSLGADTRATAGPVVADKNCEKIHYMAPNIYCCGAGTAADTEAVTGPHLHTRDEGVNLVTKAICSGIFNDLGSGSNVDICVIEKGKKEYLRNHLTPNPRTYISSKGYAFSKKTEVLLTKITPLKELVDVVQVGGDAMEE